MAQLELTKSYENLLPSRSDARIDPAAVCSMSGAGFVVQLGVAPEACVAKGIDMQTANQSKSLVRIVLPVFVLYLLFPSI